VAEYIARAIKSNVRELEGALTRLMAYASLTGGDSFRWRPRSRCCATSLLRRKSASHHRPDPENVSASTSICGEQDLKVRSNTRAIAFPRQVAMYIVKQLTTAFASGDRPAIRRQASYDGAAFDQQDRRVAAVRQRPEPHHHAADGRVTVTRWLFPLSLFRKRKPLLPPAFRISFYNCCVMCV